MNLSILGNVRAFAKYILSMVLVAINIVLGATSVSFCLVLGAIVLNIFFPTQIESMI